MADVDLRLNALAEQAVPPALASLDAHVLARVAGHSFAKESLWVRTTAIAFAMLMGVAGGMLPDTRTRAGQPAPGLSEAAEFAPSTLLAGAP